MPHLGKYAHQREQVPICKAHFGSFEQIAVGQLITARWREPYSC
jgi:hypothetical protein